MALKKNKPLGRFGRVVAIVAATLVVSLLADFAQKTLDTYRLNRQIQALELEVDAARAENQALKERLAYAATESFIEEAARESLRWVKPGEVPVVILAVEGEAASAPTLQSQNPGAASYWQLWWELLFGVGL